MMGGLALLVTAFVLGLNNWNRLKDKAAFADKLAAMGRETSATLLIAPDAQDEIVSYYFLVNGRAYTVEEKIERLEPEALKTSMPLEKGDEFIVRYIPNNPRLHDIDYSRPTEKQLNTYRDRAIDKYLQLFPETDSVFCACMAKIAYELNGLDGYADFYFQDVSAEENPQHNRNSFQSPIVAPSLLSSLNRSHRRC